MSTDTRLTSIEIQLGRITNMLETVVSRRQAELEYIRKHYDRSLSGDRESKKLVDAWREIQVAGGRCPVDVEAELAAL